MNKCASRLTLSLIQDSTKASVACTCTVSLKDANPNQLRMFLDLVNGVKAYNASFQGKSLGNLFVLHKGHQYACSPYYCVYVFYGTTWENLSKDQDI